MKVSLIAGFRIFIGVAFILSLLGGGFAVALPVTEVQAQVPEPKLVINEIDYDQIGTDGAEYVEIKNIGTASADLSGYSLQLINGTGGGAAQYQLFALPAVTLVPGEYYVVCGNAANVANCDFDVSPDTDLVQNGAPDAVALLFGTTIVDTVSYEGNTGAPYTETTGTSAADSNTVVGSIARCPDGVDTDVNNADFTFVSTITPGAANSCSAPPTDTPPTVSSTTPANNATNVAIDSNISITFNEPVTVTGSWFTISCGSSGAHTAAVSGSTPTFTLNPDSDFANSETCTVTISAAGVADQDGTADNMAANYVFTFTTPAGVTEPPDVIINEVDSDTPGTDALEFVELFDGGTGNTSLSGLVVVFYNGSNDLSYASYDLDGYSTDANGYFVLGNSALSPDITFAGNLLQNGQDAVALYLANAADFPNNTALNHHQLIDAIVYDTSDDDDPGLLALLNAAQPQVDENANALGATESSQRCPNGSGGLRNTSTYAQWAPTPGNVNICRNIPTVIINEVDSDTPGTDALEFVELFDGGTGNTSLSGLVVVFYNGSNDLSYASYDLDGYSTDANGYLLLGNSALSPDITFAGNLLQNGQDAVALYLADATDFPNNTALTTTNLIDALVYDTSDDDDPGLLALLNAAQPQVDENANATGATESNQRCPNGSGGARNTSTYAQWVPTPGTANLCANPEACGDPSTPIHNVQGSGAASPVVATEVAVEGVVVGDFQNNASADDGDLNGFHLQAPASAFDADPATSEGVFIYYPAGATEVLAGDGVRVRGTVSEYNGMTEITVSQIWKCSTGNSVSPATLALPVANLDVFEAHEGMLVSFPQALVISEYFDFDRYNEIMLTSVRHLTPTALVEPGAPAIALAASYLLDSITLDDGRTTQNSDPALHPDGTTFDMTNLFRGGDLLSNVTGVLDYSFDLYRIQPTQGASHLEVNPRPVTPPDVGGSLKVVSMNVLNYFVTLNSRGANTSEEFTRQRDKTIAAIIAMNPDIAGLVEIENNDAALADLVSGLNDAAGASTYEYIHTGSIGTDEIKVALIYKPATVSPMGAFAILDSSVDARFIDTRNRPVLAQTFMATSSGGVFTVAVNHLKSKGSECTGDPDLGDGQGNCNLTRLAAAQAEVDWLASDPTGSNDTDFMIIGDLNSYDKEDPIDALMAGADDTPGTTDDFVDLLYTYQGEYAYSYVFDGQIGYLDYAASKSLAAQITGVDAWHVNADEPDLIDYDMTFKKDAQDLLYAADPFRYSDHDPIIVGLTLLKTAGAKADNAAKPATGAAGEEDETETPTALPETGFAPGYITALPQQSVEYSELGDLWLEIPALGVKTAITGVPLTAGTWDVTWLGSQAGWLEGSAFPTSPGNSVLTGHVWDALNHPGVFEKLADLRYGDQVIVHNAGKAYVYEVRERLQVSTGSVNQLLKHKDRAWVTLVTCRGFDEESGEYLSRVLVRAVLVEVK